MEQIEVNLSFLQIYHYLPIVELIVELGPEEQEDWTFGSLDEAQAIKNTDIAEELELPPVKIHCSILAEDAIKAAIADYKSKREAK